jgi:disulfide oxidoreductase YuzD
VVNILISSRTVSFSCYHLTKKKQEVAEGCKCAVKNNMSNRPFHMTYVALVGHPSHYCRQYITHPLCHHVAYSLLPISTSVYQLPRCCCSLSFSMQRHSLRYESHRSTVRNKLTITYENYTYVSSEYRHQSVQTTQAKYFFIIHFENPNNNYLISTNLRVLHTPTFQRTNKIMKFSAESYFRE